MLVYLSVVRVYALLVLLGRLLLFELFELLSQLVVCDDQLVLVLPLALRALIAFHLRLPPDASFQLRRQIRGLISLKLILMGLPGS